MALFLVVSEGPDPESARPILACSEQRILKRVAEEIAETYRLNGNKLVHSERIGDWQTLILHRVGQIPR